MAELIDPFNRRIEYVRFSVTDRCDLRCSYCIPDGFHDFEEPDNWLTFEEIERVVRAFAELGVRRIRLTGGEPLTRRNLPDLARKLAAIPGVEDLSLSTNGTRLSKLATSLREAGVHRLNVSLDSLRPDVFKSITRGNLDKVIQGLMAAKAAGFSPIKINMVVLRGVNDGEVEDMVEFCLEHGFTLRLIETMPMGDTGRKAVNDFVSLQDVRERLASRYDLLPTVVLGGGPARYYAIAGTQLKLGFITPISQHFCATCNRVRVSADGTIYLCLGQEDSVALRPLLRAGISDDGLKQAILYAIARKPERHEFRERPEKVMRFMSLTGG